LEKLRALVQDLRSQRVTSLDTETTSVYPRSADLVGVSLAYREGEAYYIPVLGPPFERARVLPKQIVLEALRPVLEDPAIGKVGQNLKYDLVVLASAGVEVRGTQFDTMVASYLLDSGGRNHGLDALSQRLLHHAPISITELIGKGKNQRRMDEVPLEQITDYAAEDADVALRLWPLLETGLHDVGLERLNAEVEVPLVDVLARMEYHGIAVDRARLAELSGRFGERVRQLEAQIEELAGHPLNLGSPKQLAEVLFAELRLPITRRGKTGPSTDASVLEELAALHPLPAKIIEYRQFAKLKNTYVDTLPQLIHPVTGRIHASFNQVTAATGRLSCGDPNLQNIPIRTEEGRAIRSAFRPDPPDWLLVTADYSQIELRVLAHFSCDATLRRAFAEDQDIHALVAGQVHGVATSEVTPEMRRRAKAVNFGVIYGQSAFGLARSLGISKSEAAEFIDAYFARYPGVEAFLAATLDACHRQGYVTTILGRRREIAGVRPEHARSLRQLQLPERTAVNTVVQGSAADLIKRAMIAVDRRIREARMQSRLLLQIHDELVFETPAGELDSLTALVTEEMTSAIKLDAPLKVDVKAGKNWAECEPRV
jgi:DNA polymerase-1